MKIMRVRTEGRIEAQRLDLERIDRDGILLVLQPAMDHEEGLLGDGKSRLLKEGRGHKGIGNAGFVFEADEDVAFGSARALAANDLASDGHSLTVSKLIQITGAQRSLRHFMPDVSHGMRAGGQALGMIVGF